MEEEHLHAGDKELVDPPVHQEREMTPPIENKREDGPPVGKALAAETSEDYRNSIIQTQRLVIYRYWKQVVIKPDNEECARKNKPRLKQICFSGYKRFLPLEGKQKNRQELVSMVTSLMKDE